MSNVKKIAIVISSFSGKLDSEVREMDMFSVPLQLIIENEQWLEGFYSNDEKSKIVEKFINAKEYSTSLPPLALILEQMEVLSKNYENVLYLPLDSQLSSTFNTLMNYAKKYYNVMVFNNHLSGSSLFRLGLECKRLYEEENKTMEEIWKYLNWFNDNSIGYIVPKELKTFIKSGRLKGIKKTLLTSINLSLMIEVGQKLKTVGISRTKKSAIIKVINRIFEFMKSKGLTTDDVDFSIIKAYEDTNANLVKNQFRELNIENYSEEDSSLATMLHTGYGALYVGINPKIKKVTK